ncbi:PAS domain S-box protein [Mucilaginibacter sp. CAU 1740]|uniref:PAS domain S-box protein n=1 Tax=Mucilaginibacter sp. CAU 1740 TaxID=3140365 RepID=UPI00325A6DCA
MLMLVGILSYLFIQNLLSSNNEVAHSNLIIQKLERTLSLMKDAETGQRGYLLTGREGFLAPYRGAYPQALQLVKEATELTQDNPQQQANMADIREVMEKRMNILQLVVEKRQQKLKVDETDFDAGKNAMDDLRQAIDKAERTEAALLNERAAVLDKYAFWTPLLIVNAIILALAIGIFSYVRVIRDLNEKERLRTELQAKEEETAAFNEELTAANEEISATNEELTAINEELTEAREELAATNDSLEIKVVERTKALQESEEETQALNEELTAINEELAAANEEYIATNEELLRARGELEKSERLFRTIAQNIPGSLIMVVGQDHHVIALEGNLFERLNYNAAEGQGKHLSEVTSPERYAANVDLYERVLAGEQFRIMRKGADLKDYQVDFVPLNDDKGNIYAGLIIALDVTDLNEGRERSAKLAAIVESSNDAIISKTFDGIITSWNSGAERMYGYSEEEMIGESILKLVPEDRHEEEPELIDRLRNGERIQHFETIRLRRDGSTLDVSLTVSPVRDAEGNLTGISKIARDISEQKRDEMRKNDFIGMVSHELKTPLTSLTAMIQMLSIKLQSNEDPFVPSALDKSNLQIRKMTSMINGFLNMSRLESGKIVIEKTLFRLDELIGEMVNETKLTVADRIFQLGDSAGLEITADRDKIGSVISNLLSNAVKYSSKGKQISISWGIEANNTKVSISDEGIGIKADDLNKLFERYYRVSNEQTRHISGFGIGLYLSAEIITLHNGRLWAESEPGEGSTFHFTLPLSEG